jgi:hypothetical protein
MLATISRLLVEMEYLKCNYSIAFPIVSFKEMSRFIEQSKIMGEIALLKSFRNWLRDKIKTEI